MKYKKFNPAIHGVGSKADGLKGAAIYGPLGGEQFYFNKKEIDKYKGAAKTAGGFATIIYLSYQRTQNGSGNKNSLVEIKLNYYKFKKIIF